MKKLGLLLTMLFAAVSINAQDFKATLTSLTKNSETDFVSIMGTKSSFTGKNGTVFYDSKLKLGVGNEFISKKENDKAAIYTLSSEYVKAKELEKAVNDFVYSYFPASKYDIEVEKYEFYGTYFLEVFEKKAAFPFLEISLDIDKDLTSIYSITLYSKSAQVY